MVHDTEYIQEDLHNGREPAFRKKILAIVRLFFQSKLLTLGHPGHTPDPKSWKFKRWHYPIQLHTIVAAINPLVPRREEGAKN